MKAQPLGQRSRIGPFHGSVDALAIAEAAGKVRSLLVITAHAGRYEKFTRAFGPRRIPVAIHTPV